ncbi:glycosyltransferase [Bacillus sp. B1-b2]|uniref:glycosyltransferase n=1 Tax=Bacillus sp. B1-b2 TaxID=2653201 RepID=UPI001262AAED|nr:glycosyltransferase [Bacillus sp. B1-b2]KAB7671726.1 glycosyltransferase [Bacillus sp. B1-b2]
MIPEKKIKVLFLDHTSVIGGGERSLIDLLIYINKDRFQPVLICFEDGPLIERVASIDGVEVHIIPFSEKVLKYNRDKKSISQLFSIIYLILPMVKLFHYVMKSKAKVIYCNSMKAHFIGLIVGKLTNKKVIWHVRDILDGGLNRKLFIGFSRFADNIICISKAVSKQFKESEKVKIVYNGIYPMEERGISERV